MNQIKNSWDYKTLQKVGKGALIAGGSAVAIYLLQWIMTVDLGVYTPMAVAIAGIVINAIKEYMKGIDKYGN
ncbi:MAG: hypothetical protein KAR44_14835 [Candidatus Aegiribacteria sp.]|nr:hypothetical protein [Candidatus Aegiribacteria sp.]